MSFGYDNQSFIFENISTELRAQDDKGHVIALMGASGSGKSTLLKLLLDVITPQAGEIKFEPVNSTFSYLPQEPVLFEHMSPMDNARYFSFASKMQNKFDEALFLRLVDALEMQEVLQDRDNVNLLSGGQKQRLSLLRALSIKPDFLLLDEPCTGLDADVKFSLLNKLKELIKELGILAVYVTHHVDEAKFISDEVAFIVKDQINKKNIDIKVSDTRQFLSRPPTIDAARMIGFPNVNILGVQLSEPLQLVARQPQAYILLREENIRFHVESEKNTIQLKRQTYNGLYENYLHEDSNSRIILNRKIEQNPEELHISFCGTSLKYDTNGILSDSGSIALAKEK